MLTRKLPRCFLSSRMPFRLPFPYHIQISYPVNNPMIYQTYYTEKEEKNDISDTRPNEIMIHRNNGPKKRKKRAEHDEKLDRRVYPIALSSFLIGTSVSMILPLMPIFCKEIGVSSAGYGVMVGAVGLTRLLTNLPAGWLADRVGRRPLLISGPLITAVGVAGIGLSHSFYPVLFGRALTGIGGAMDMTAAQLYLSDISTPANRARIFAPAVMAFSAGSVVGPAIGGWLASHYSFQVPFLLVSVGIAGVAFTNYMMLSETREKSQFPAADISFRDQLKGLVSQWKPLLRQRDIRSVLFLHGSFWFVSSSCIYTMLPMLGADVFALSTTEIAVWYVIMAAMNILGTSLSAYISDHYGRKVSLVPGATFLALSTVAMPFASSYEQMTALVVLWGCGGALFGANTTAYLTDKATEGTKTQALGLLRSCSDIGLMAGGGFAGVTSQFIDPSAPFLAASALITIAGLNFALRASESNSLAKSPFQWGKKPKNNKR